MTRTLRGSLLIASMLVVLWTTSSQACHRRRSCQSTCYCQSGCGYAGPHGLLRLAGAATQRQGYYGGGYYGGGYPGGYYGGRLSRRVRPAGYGYGQPGTGYDFGRPGYNPGGLGGPASGIGVRPGLGAGGFGRGADRPQVLRSPCGGRAAWSYGLTKLGRCRRRSTHGGRGRQVRRLELQPVRPGVTPVATRPLDTPSRFVEFKLNA